jgi:flagellar motor switch protein FliM
MHLATDPGGWRAALVIDANATSFLMEGALGGDGSSLPELSSKGLSGAQAAIIGRVADRIATAFSSVLVESTRFGFTKLPSTTEGPPGGALLASLGLGLGEHSEYGTLTLLLAKEALLGTAAAPAAREAPVDPRVIGTLVGVELELVVELGRLSMTLGALSALRAGDTLLLDVPVDGTVAVRVGDQNLLTGRPTTSGSRLAVRVEKLGG